MNAPINKPVARPDVFKEAREREALGPRYEDEEEFEPIPGLPEIPPEGEHILWRGEPAILPVARRVFHIGWITVYFALLAIWSVVDAVNSGASLSAALGGTTIILVPYVLAMTLFLGWALCIARTTIYTLTNKRLVIRAGVALSKAINIPFAQVENAVVREGRDGSVDIALTLVKDAKPAYLLLWPHARPWNWKTVQPMMRGITDETCTRVLVSALTEYHGANYSDQKQANEKADDRASAGQQPASA